MNIITENYQLYNGDCLEVMDYLIEQNIKVDCILTDPPYGTTACKWDTVIPFDEMWLRLNKLIKPNGAIVLFGVQPFFSYLICSNIKDFKYELIWEKEGATNFMFLKKQFGKVTENIAIFYKKQPTYNPQMVKMGRPVLSVGGNGSKTYKNQEFKSDKKPRDEKYPTNILRFNRDRKKSFHPTQKPVGLLEYLIKTYTNEGEVVLDFTMGSGSTGVACMNLNRKFIGIELDNNYFDIAVNRIFENYNI
jgi:site-specific DNA-methyltransferase (adenine-specific)